MSNQVYLLYPSNLSLTNSLSSLKASSIQTRFSPEEIKREEIGGEREADVERAVELREADGATVQRRSRLSQIK